MFANDMDSNRIVESIACASHSTVNSRQDAAPIAYALFLWERHPAANFYDRND